MTESTGNTKAQRALGAYTNLVRATESVVTLLSRQLATFGLTMSQFGVLEALLHVGPMSQATLGDKLLCGDSNMKLVVGNLQKWGLVLRRAHEKDGRKMMVHLTPAGQKLIAKVFPRHSKLVRARMSALMDREQETLRRLCQKLGDGDAVKFVLELTAVDEGDEQ